MRGAGNRAVETQTNDAVSTVKKGGNFMLTLTDKAVKRLKDLIGAEKLNDYGVRIFTTSGG